MTHTARLRTSTGPIDRVAARVIRSGIHYERAVHPGEKIWKDNPPRTVPFRGQARNPQSVDLTGHRFGRFTVTGYLGPVGKSGGKGKKRMGLWLVRCACGLFEQRSAHALRANADDCCGDCRNLKYLKLGIDDPKTQIKMMRRPA